MWYLILALLFGQGGETATTNGQPTTLSTPPGAGVPGDGGDTGVPIPPRPPKS